MNSEREKLLFKKRLVRLFGIEKEQIIERVVDKHYVPGERDKSKERFISLIQTVRLKLKEVGRHQPFFINNKLKNFSQIKEIVNNEGIIRDQVGKKNAERTLKSQVLHQREDQRLKLELKMKELRSSLREAPVETQKDFMRNRSLKPKKKKFPRKSADKTETHQNNAVLSVTHLNKIQKFLKEEEAPLDPHPQVSQTQSRSLVRPVE